MHKLKDTCKAVGYYVGWVEAISCKRVVLESRSCLFMPSNGIKQKAPQNQENGEKTYLSLSASSVSS